MGGGISRDTPELIIDRTLGVAFYLCQEILLFSPETLYYDMTVFHWEKRSLLQIVEKSHFLPIPQHLKSKAIIFQHSGTNEVCAVGLLTDDSLLLTALRCFFSFCSDFFFCF